MPATDPDISRPRLIRDGSFLEADWNEIAQRRGAHNRLGFAYQIVAACAGLYFHAISSYQFVP